MSLQALRERGCGGEEQMAAVLREVSAEPRAGTEGWQLLGPFPATYKSPLWWLCRSSLPAPSRRVAMLSAQHPVSGGPGRLGMPRGSVTRRAV